MRELTIITSNIRYANPADGAHDWPHRLPHLINFYKDTHPDILGTQEGRQPQLKELDEGLPELQLVDSHREWIDVRMYPCLFINPKTIKVIRSGDIWLSETPYVNGSNSFSSSFPRLCTWAEIEVIENSMKMLVVNTHLDHVLSETRVHQIRVLIEEVKKISSLPLVIMGDFNEPPLTNLKTTLMNAFDLKDPWVEKNYPEETSHHGFSGSASRPGERIDWILIPKSFECLKLYLEKRSFNNIYPSDHYPLLATVIPK